MKTANIMLAIGGGRDNTVPKENVTAAEIAVLRAIHGEDAVFDVEPTSQDALDANGQPVKNRQELARLKRIYGGAKDGNGTPHVENLFPGVAARVYEGFDELDLPEDFFKATGRLRAATPAKPKSKAELIAYAQTRGIAVDEKASAKAISEAIEAAEAAASGDGEDEDNGIGDTPDAGIFR
jgi:hypothetical protein